MRPRSFFMPIFSADNMYSGSITGFFVILAHKCITMRRLTVFIAISAALITACTSGEYLTPETVESAIFTDRDTLNEWNRCLPDMPEPTVAMRVTRYGTYGRTYNDSNYIHWASAESIGIQPMSDMRSHWQLRRPLVKVESCADYYVEPLRYSRPYMIPEGAAMLREIGRRFRDTLAARGGGDYRVKVTSVLRTPEAVGILRRRNRNAIDSSVHQLGTTVDISYSRFIADSDRMPRSADDLKAALAEVLYAMREEGKCWVKYERKQPCFHITVRPGYNSEQ